MLSPDSARAPSPAARPSRRQFVVTALLARPLAAALAAGPWAAAATHAAEPLPPRPLGLGFSLYGMKSLGLSEALSHCAALGYDGVELALMSGFHADPAALSAEARRAVRSELADRGLALMGLMDNLPLLADEAGHQANLERLKRAAELARDLAAPGPTPVLETILGSRPADWPAVRSRFVERLGEWVEVLDQHQLTVALKPHVGNALRNPQAARALVDEVGSPRLRAAFDFSHYQVQGLALEDCWRPLADVCAFIHVKDVRGAPEKFEFLLPGEGTTDYAAYAAMLKRSGYRGPIVVEVSAQISNRPEYDPVAAARRSYEALARAWQAAGIERRARPPAGK